MITSTDFRKVLAVGYNGNATGLANSCDRDEAGNCGCLHSEENAVIKAVKYSLWLKREHGVSAPVIAEDSGLMVFSLMGWPGVHSARIAETDVERNWMVLDKLSGKRDRSAQFLAYTALAVNGVLVDSWRGSVTGAIAEEPRGNNGFGYDPIFIDLRSGRTFAELSKQEKNELSHRNQAWTQAFDYLKLHQSIVR